MLGIIKNALQNRRDRREMIHMRYMVGNMHNVLFAQDAATGALVRMKTGLRLTQLLETHLGLMGPDYLNPVNSDYDLEREGEALDKLHPAQLNHVAAELGRLAERTVIEKGNPDTWEDGEDTANAANIVALRLVMGWLRCKAIVHTSLNRRVIQEAREHENLFYTDIKRLLRLFRGEKAIKEGEG